MIAFIFPGQGSQRVGMGADLHADLMFDRLMSQAEELSGAELRQLCANGPLESLTATAVAQPAIFVTSLVLAHDLRKQGLVPMAVAGHSLGEYTAAVFAGALGESEGLSAVVERGRLMAEAQRGTPGVMAAVIGLERTRVEEVCATARSEGVVVVANVNAPGQVVVSGELAAVERAMDLALEAGAEQASRLPVGAAFHSPLMAPVQEQMTRVLEGLEWRDPVVPIVGASDGGIRRISHDLRQMLTDQITRPVRWDQCVAALLREGCQLFVEVGPGRVLSGLTRLNAPDARTSVVGTLEQASALASRYRAE